MPPEPNQPPFTYTDLTPIVLTPTPTPGIAAQPAQTLPTLEPIGAILFAVALVAAAVLAIRGRA